MKISFPALVLATLSLTACDSKNAPPEDIVQDVDRNRAVESAISVLPSDSVQILRTEHKVWVNNSEYKTIVHTDTIPALGVTTDPVVADDGTTEQASNANGRYKIYITVK